MFLSLMKVQKPESNQGESIYVYIYISYIYMNLYLIAIYGLKAIKPKQTLVKPTGNCKELNSYLYIYG